MQPSNKKDYATLPAPKFIGDSLSVRYLLDAGLLNNEQILAGIRVVTTWGRNGGIRVICSMGPSFFLKQARSPEDRRWLEREASIYQWLHTEPLIAPIIPVFYGFDRANGILRIGLEPGSKSQWALDIDDRRQPPIEAANAAAALARLHQLDWDPAIPVAPRIESNSLPHARWLAELPAVDWDIFTESSAAALQAIRLIQADESFCRMLNELRNEWDETVVIHGDIRPANIMVRPPVSGGWRIALVDWELAGLGDPSWDLGSYFVSYLERWVRSMPFGPKLDLNLIVSHAASPLTEMRPAISAFWGTYLEKTSLGSKQSNALLFRVVRMSALRLLQLTLEKARTTAELTPQNYAEIQLARNILENPVNACRQLLGVSA